MGHKTSRLEYINHTIKNKYLTQIDDYLIDLPKLPFLAELEEYTRAIKSITEHQLFYGDIWRYRIKDYCRNNVYITFKYTSID